MSFESFVTDLGDIVSSICSSKVPEIAGGLIDELAKEMEMPIYPGTGETLIRTAIACVAPVDAETKTEILTNSTRRTDTNSGAYNYPNNPIKREYNSNYSEQPDTIITPIIYDEPNKGSNIHYHDNRTTVNINFNSEVTKEQFSEVEGFIDRIRTDKE